MRKCLTTHSNICFVIFLTIYNSVKLAVCDTHMQTLLIYLEYLQIKRCGEMARKLRFFQEHMMKAGLPPSSRPITRTDVDLDDLEVKVSLIIYIVFEGAAFDICILVLFYFSCVLI